MPVRSSRAVKVRVLALWLAAAPATAAGAAPFDHASPEKNRVEVEAGIVYGSPIYASHYRDDFGGSDAAIGRFLAAYYPDGLERQLLSSGRFKLVENRYDWTLNSQEQARKLAAAAKRP